MDHTMPPQQVVYRPPRPGDLPQLVEIYNYAIRETAATFDTEEKTTDYFTPWLAGDRLHRMLVVESGGQAIAYAGTYPYSPRPAYGECGSFMIYVHPAWHGQGVGSALLAEIHRGDFLEGLHTILVVMNKDNVQSRRMFGKQGYACKAELDEVGWKFGKRHSVVVYQRHVRA